MFDQVGVGRVCEDDEGTVKVTCASEEAPGLGPGEKGGYRAHEHLPFLAEH